MSLIVKILGMKPVQDLIHGLTKKLFGRKYAVNHKVGAVLGVDMWIALAVMLAQVFDPGLAEILEANVASIIAVVVMGQSIVAYYTPNEA